MPEAWARGAAHYVPPTLGAFTKLCSLTAAAAELPSGEEPVGLSASQHRSGIDEKQISHTWRVKIQQHLAPQR